MFNAKTLLNFTVLSIYITLVINEVNFLMAFLEERWRNKRCFYKLFYLV